jgi:hypothetical protein
LQSTQWQIAFFAREGICFHSRGSTAESLVIVDRSNLVEQSRRGIATQRIWSSKLFDCSRICNGQSLGVQQGPTAAESSGENPLILFVVAEGFEPPALCSQKLIMETH